MKREYTIKKIVGAPDWNTVETAEIDTLCWTQPLPIQAFAQVCYDEQALYVHLRAVEKDIRAEETDALGSPCSDSCREFFFCPVADDPRYFNFEFNLNTCHYIGIGTSGADLTRLISENPSDSALFQPKAQRTADGWEIFYQIPFCFIRRFFSAFRPEGEISGNFYKCGDLTVQEHYLSWNPMTSETPAFHRTCDFGSIRFE